MSMSVLGTVPSVCVSKHTLLEYFVRLCGCLAVYLLAYAYMLEGIASCASVGAFLYV